MAATRRINVSGAIARYRTARTSLHTPGSRQSRYGLDWMNFFIADVQTGFGTFVAFYLARLSWSTANHWTCAGGRRHRRCGGSNPGWRAC